MLIIEPVKIMKLYSFKVFSSSLITIYTYISTLIGYMHCLLDKKYKKLFENQANNVEKA